MPDLITQKFTATHKDHLQKITEKITHETAVHKALRMASAPPSSSSGANGVGQSRTMAGPEWGSDEPVNWRKTLNLTGISVADFDSGNTHHGYMIK